MAKNLDSFPKIIRRKNNTTVDIVDVGGVSNIVYNIIRYKNYKYKEVNDPYLGKYCIVPVGKPLVSNTDIDALTGGDILISLYNLAKSINDKNNKTPAYEEIIDWCSSNLHPYDLKSLYEKYKPIKKGESRIDFPKKTDGYINMDEFIKDLSYLYQTFSAYIALDELIKGRPEMAYNLAEEGKYFDTLIIFNQYKLGKFEDEPASDDKPISAKDLIKEMQKDRTYTVTLKGFRDNVIRHKTEIMESIVYRIPEIKMFLGIERGKVKILAEFDSIFDICWYSLIRLLAVNGEIADEDLEGVSATRFNEVHYGVCSCCRNLFKINSNRQRYCHSELCQQERNRKKIREYRRRQAENK